MAPVAGSGAGRDVEGDDGVPELGLVDHAHGRGRVQRRDAAQPHARHARQRVDRRPASPPRRQGSPRARCRPARVGRPRSLSTLARLGRWPPSRHASSSSTPSRARRRDRSTAAVAAARAGLAERHRAGFMRGRRDRCRGSSRGPPDDTPFGAPAARRSPADVGAAASSSSGSGAIPLATAADRRGFVAAAGATDRAALANNRYSADVVAIAARRASSPTLPDLPTRQRPAALARRGRRLPGRRPARPLAARRRHRRSARPRPARRRAGRASARRRRIAIARPRPARRRPARRRATRGAELLVAGRTSPRRSRWLERRDGVPDPGPGRGARPAHAPLAGPATARARVLGALLDRDGPASLGTRLARLGDARPHRHPGPAGPPPRRRRARAGRRAEDRFASDLLLPRPDRRSVAAGADRGRRRRADPGRPRRPHARRAGPPAGVGGGRVTAMDGLDAGLVASPPDLDASARTPALVDADPRRDRARPAR